MTATPGRLVNPPGTAHRGLAPQTARPVDRAGHHHAGFGRSSPTPSSRAGLASVFGVAVRGAGLPLAVLLAAHLASRAAGVVSPGDPHPLDPARLPDDLLLLPQGLLPRVLRRSAGLRGRRAAIHRGYAMERASRSSCRTCTATSCTSPSSRSSSCGSTSSLSFVSTRAVRDRARQRVSAGQRRPAHAYTFSCHSLRHLVGGSLDCFSCGVATRRAGLWSA